MPPSTPLDTSPKPLGKEMWKCGQGTLAFDPSGALLDPSVVFHDPSDVLHGLSDVLHDSSV